MKKTNIYLAVIMLSFYRMCLAETIPSIDAPDQRKVYGIITSIEQTPTGSGQDQGRQWMGSMFGVIGVLFTDLMSNSARSHPIYHVKVSDNIELEVGSRNAFDVGDCVVIWYLDRMGDVPSLIHVGDAGIARSKECSIAQNN